MHVSSGSGVSRFRTSLRAASLATLVTLVIVLALFQYRWIGELGEAQEARAFVRLSDTVKALTDAFDTEATRAILVFEIPPAAIAKSSGLEPLERRWREWNSTARWPQIISGVALLESSDGHLQTQWIGSPAKSDVASILRVHGPSTLASLAGPRRIVVRDPVSQVLSLDGQPAVVLPLSAFSARPGMVEVRSVLVHLDEDYLAKTVFPQLLDAHSTAEDRKAFRFEIARGTDHSVDDETAAVAGVLHVRRDCLLGRTGRRTILSSGDTLSHRPGSSLTRLPPRPDVADGIPVDVLIQAAGRCQTPPARETTGVMQLIVRRQEAPMQRLLTRFRRRTQIASGVVLATLLVTMAVLVISAERARALARMQTVVAAGISHELRTPLASLRIAADDLKSGQVDNREQARRYGEIIDGQSRRLGHVVDQAIALAGATTRNGSQQHRPVSVVEILDVATATLSQALRRASVSVERSVPTDVPQIVVDREMVVGCLTNLIENSIKYAASGGYIFLSVRAVRRCGKLVVEFSVEDRGPGIDDDEMAAVFEPFYRGKSARQSRQSGSGLGLTVVKSAVEAHGGWIRVERVKPHGCRFNLFFPSEAQAGSQGT